MKKKYYSTDINQLLEDENFSAIEEVFNDLSTFEIADILSHKNEEEQALLFKTLSFEKKKETFDYLPLWAQKNVLLALPSSDAAKLLGELSPDDRTNFLQIIPQDTVEELVKVLPTEERTLTLALLGYPKGSIGRLMTPDYIAVQKEWTVGDVLDHIQHYGRDCETVDNIYVVDPEGYLLDEIPLKEFIFTPNDTKVESMVGHPSITLHAFDHDEIAIKKFRELSRTALPVIDEQGMLLGVVTIDDVLRLSNQEATEDIQKLAGMGVLEEPYLQAPFLELMKKRAGWLITLFLGGMLTATAMTYFEEEISRAVVLALFIPLINSSGGNAGSQATMLVIRAMALGEVKISDWWKIVRLEIASGVFLGVILGIIGFVRVTTWGAFLNTYGEHWLLLGYVVGVSLIGVVIWGTVSGAMFPLLLHRLGLDPAMASAPFVATTVDVSGVIIYFFVAILILKGTLL